MENVNLSGFMYNIIKERVYQFNYEQINTIIQHEMMKQGFPNYEFWIKSWKYVNTLLEVLEYMEEKRELYTIGGLYVPLMYGQSKKYSVENSNLVYSFGLIQGNNQDINDIERFYDVENGERIFQDDVQKKIVLTGELLPSGDYLQPKVPLYQVQILYRKLMEQGSSMEEAMNSILKYYHAEPLGSKVYQENYSNHYQIFPKVRTKKLKFRSKY